MPRAGASRSVQEQPHRRQQQPVGAERGVAETVEEGRRLHEERRAEQLQAPVGCRQAQQQHPNTPCSTKQSSSHAPRYCDGSGSSACSGFSAKATTGMASVFPIDVPTGCPTPSMRPGGQCHGSWRKWVHADT